MKARKVLRRFAPQEGWMMKRVNLDYVIKELPLFSGLSRQERRVIRMKSGVVEFKKGQVIYKEGSAAGYLYFIIRGRVVISSQDHYGKQTVLEYLHRGKYFGIISVLTAEAHSVTARALNDCLLLTISRKDFEGFMKRIPRLGIDLSKTLSRRLKRKDLHQKKIFESTIIAALSSYPHAGKTIYASNLAFSIAREAHKSVVIVDICPQDKCHRMPRLLKTPPDYRVFNLSGRSARPRDIKDYILKDKFGIDLVYLAYDKQKELNAGAVIDILSLLVNDYHYVILDLPCSREKGVLAVLNQADIIHILTSPRAPDLKSSAKLIKRLQADFYFPAEKIKVIINRNSPSKSVCDEKSVLLGHDIFASLPKIECRVSGRLVLEKPDFEYSKVIRRISRQEGDCLVGLALGVGVAYGFCHIGVFKVIEDEKIPIDVISGASMGAVIASLWAIGKSSGEILEITREFREPKYIWSLLDFTFPLLGFIKGNKLYNFLKRHLGGKTFYDVRVPLKIIASDVKRKEPRVFDKGSLVDALMASCSMPGVFAPFKMKEEMLFDGGVINPLPTEPLFEMGVKKIIAVNVTPSREDILRQYEQLKSKVASPEGVIPKDWFNLKNFLKEKLKNNILDIIFSSFEIMQSEVALKEAQFADLVLHPDTAGLHWLELHRSAEFAQRGEEETRAKLDKIWKLIGE
ncbi:MAG: patatin-like phospholipase family protein [Candidatus Omnitrophica bacterium]|nr:patatin-like phospholipase family protein [Candidatus Omnitrophota bacterium]